MRDGPPPARIAIVSGYFNPLHVGHLRLIHGARELAPHVIAIVNNDDQQLLKKGRIILPAEERLAIVAELRSVDEALIASDADGSVAQTLRLIRERYPDADLVFCNGGDRGAASDSPSIQTAVCEELGIAVRYGVGGRDKADSSTRINEALGRN